MATVFPFTGAVEASAGPPTRSAGALPVLPCLSSHKCNEKEGTLNVLSGSQKRTAFVLAVEIQNLAKDFGLQKLGFLTLTFADLVLDLREAQRRFHSLCAGVLNQRYRRAIGCWERQKSGRIHFHLVVVLADDIRSGFDFAALARRDYRSASVALRSEWAFWRGTAPKYGFGRTELLPVKSTAEGIARYVGKYISKHIRERVDADKGARVVRFIGFKPGERRACARFSWNSDGAWLWRQKLQAFCERHGYQDTDHLKNEFGPRWAWLLQGAILVTELGGVSYRSEKASQMDDGASQVESAMDRLERAGSRVYHLKPSPGQGQKSVATKSAVHQERSGNPSPMLVTANLHRCNFPVVASIERSSACAPKRNSSLDVGQQIPEDSPRCLKPKF